MKFSTAGLTVFYGNNGSGKSGYIRVLKSACQTRGVSEHVLSNGFLTPSPPSAVIHFSVGQESRSFEWNDNTNSAILSNVSVFDTKAASALLEKNNEILWIPSGLHLLASLAKTMGTVGENISRKKNDTSIRTILPRDLSGDSQQFLSNLNEKTSIEEIEKFRLSHDEEIELQKTSKILTIDNVEKEIKSLGQKEKRIEQFRKRLTDLRPFFNSEFDRLKETWERQQKVTKSEYEFSKQNIGKVAEMNNSSFRILWEAAEKYASMGGTSDREFPSKANDSICVLCNQTLEGTVKTRLNKFRSFVHSDIVNQRKSTLKDLQDLISKVAQVDIISNTDPIFEELGELDPVRIKSFQNRLLEFVAWQEIIKQTSFDEVFPEIEKSPSLRINNFLKEIESEIQVQKKELRESKEVESRKILIQLKENCLHEIAFLNQRRLCFQKSID